MFKLVKILKNPQFRQLNSVLQKRTFLSPAYYCKEAWDNRLKSPILQKVNFDILYHELEQRFQKTRQISAVDVDVFVNALNSNIFIDELMDIVYKLRLSAEASSVLNSTTHAVIRLLLQFDKTDDLLNALDDRLNYGLFLDGYTANILLDHFWKKQDFLGGARVASQLMLQEDFEHPIARAYSLLHCYNYLLKPTQWPEYPKPEEPEEEVKVRVKYIRNPYFDNHFDLRDGNKIVGKTLAFATKSGTDSVEKCLNILGWALFGNDELLNKSINSSAIIHKDIFDLLPEETKKSTNNMKIELENTLNLLENNVKMQINDNSEKDIAKQCQVYEKWETERNNELEIQKQMLLKQKRLSEIEQLQQTLKEKERKLWFFEKQEQIEVELEAAQEQEAKIEETKVIKKGKDTQEDYIPPEIGRKQIV